MRVLTRFELLSLSAEERARMGIRSPVIGPGKSAPRRRDEGAGIEVSGLSFTVKSRRIFDGLDLRIPQGNMVALTARNGIGKTTLARVVCGLAKEKSGTISLSGEAMGRRRRRRTSYFVIQNADCQLFADSVAEELRLNRPGLTDDEVDELLGAYGLADFRDAHPMTLSGGQKQRLAIAVAELLDAPVILLDEPTSGLDFRNMQRIAERLGMLASNGKTVLVISHDYEFIASSCTAAIRMGGPGRAERIDMAEPIGELLAALME